MRIYDIYNKIFFMKNLFVITEEEKNRILKLHESATKNLYLVNETASIPDVVGVYSDVANCLGFDIVGGTSNCKRVMIFDGQVLQNLISNVCDNGYLDFKVENDWKNTTISGSWVVSDQNVTVTMSDGTKFTGMLTPGSLKTQVTSWLVKQPKFAEFVKDLGPEVENTWKSWGGGEVQPMPEPDMESQVKAHAQYCKWGDDIQGFLDSGKKCPKPGSKDGSNLTGEQGKSKYYQQITDLQTKVGAENTGTLDQATLKKIMDKLSQ